MIGQAGIGKSEFWSKDKTAFFIDTEGNLEHLPVMKLPCRSWDDFIDIGSLLIKSANEGKFPYSTVVVDTVDKWLDYASEEVIGRARTKYAKSISAGLEINTIGDIPEGNGWFSLKGLISNYLAKMANLPCAVALIGHTQIKEVKDPVKKYDKTTINIGGQMGVMLLGWANHIMNVEGIYQGANLVRTVYTRPTQSREAKSHGGTIPNDWRWGDDMEENFGKFKGLFQ